MRAWRAWFLLFVGLWAPGAASAEDPVVGARFSPPEAWVGQRVLLQVDVLAAEAWAQLAHMPRIELPGSYVLPPQGQGVRLQETIDGKSYSGQRYEFFVYPQRAGSLALPETAIEVHVRRLGIEAGEEPLSARLPGMVLESRVPPGAEGIEGLISTTALSVDQRWEPADGVKRVGDAVRRTLHFEAADISGMAFRPIDPAPVDGLGVYPAEPRVDDRFDRGSLQGSRTEVVTYVAERPGQFELPAIAFAWWDTAREQLRKIELPGMTFRVTGPAPVVGPTATDTGSRAWWWLLPAVASVALLALLRRPLARAWRAAARARARSERHLFRLVQAAIRRGQPAPVMRELMRWLDRISETHRPARLDQFADAYGDAQLRTLLGALQRELAESTPVTDRRALSRHLGEARRRWLQRAGRDKAEGRPLPPLNATPLENPPL